MSVPIYGRSYAGGNNAVPVEANPFGGLTIVDGRLIPLGYEQITGLSSAQSLTVPTGARLAVICAETQTVRWRDDGVDPTNAVGMPLPTNAYLIYNGDLGAFRAIETAASAVLNVEYYK